MWREQKKEKKGKKGKKGKEKEKEKGPGGVEPPTYRAATDCSTTEL